MPQGLAQRSGDLMQAVVRYCPNLVEEHNVPPVDVVAHRKGVLWRTITNRGRGLVAGRSRHFS